MTLRYVTTIVMPAPSYNLFGLQDVHSFGGIPTVDTGDDAFIAYMIPLISAGVIKYCKNRFVQETIQDLIYFDASLPRGQIRISDHDLQTSRWPIESVTSVSVLEDGTPTALSAGTDFIVDGDNGQLLRLDSNTGLPRRWSALPTTVIYVAGYLNIPPMLPVPPDIVNACCKMMSKALASNDRDPMLKGITEGGVSKEYWIDMARDGSFPPEVSQILDMYRVPVAR